MKKNTHNKTKIEKKSVLGRKSDTKKVKKQAKISAHKTALNKGLRSKNAVIKAKSEKLYQALYTKQGKPRKRISQQRINAINEDIKELKRIEYINSPQYERDVKNAEKENRIFATGQTLTENKKEKTWDDRQHFDNSLKIWKQIAKQSLNVKPDSSEVIELARTYKSASETAKVKRVMKYIKKKMEDDVPPLFKKDLTADDTYRAIAHGLNLEDKGIKLKDLEDEEAIEIISMMQEPSAEYIDELKERIKERKHKK